MSAEAAPQGDAPSVSGEGGQEQGQSSVARVWAQYREVIFQRLGAVEAAATALRKATLTPEVRQKAVLESHRLAGSLGMFGLDNGTRVAREIEHLLTNEAALLSPDAPRRLVDSAAALRAELEKGPA